MRRYSVFLIGFVIFCGCAVKSQYLADNLKPEDAYISWITMRSFSIVDERTGVSDRLLDPKFFMKAGTSDRVSPALTEEQKSFIKNEVLKYTGKNGQGYDITVFVEKGEKVLRSEWPTKFEGVNLSLKIQFTIGGGTKTASADASLEIKSLKATDEYMDKMFLETIKECIHECFAALKKQQA